MKICKFILLNVLFVFIVSLLGCATLSKPQSNDIGGIAGKFTMKLDKKFVTFDSKIYDDNITLWFKNTKSDEKYKTYVNGAGDDVGGTPPGAAAASQWRIENVHDNWIEGEIGDGYDLKTNIERKSYMNQISVKQKSITIIPEINVRVAFPSSSCHTEVCYMEYENVYTRKCSKSDVLNSFRKKDEEVYTSWSNFKWQKY